MRRVGILVESSEYLKIALAVCVRACVNNIVFDWLANDHVNLSLFENEGVTDLIFEGDAAHYGFHLARKVLEELGIAPIVISW